MNRSNGFRQHNPAILIVAVGSALLASACQRSLAEPESQASAFSGGRTANAVERGEYLVNTAGCQDCHTPMKMGAGGPEPDRVRMLSGHPEGLKMPPAPRLPEGPWLWVGSATNTAFAGPWGVTYAINLTPDKATGLSAWTEEMFVTALKTGKHIGASRPIMPPMPWPAYSQMTDEDLRAMYAYLRTVPAIQNHVPEYVPPATGTRSP